MSEQNNPEQVPNPGSGSTPETAANAGGVTGTPGGGQPSAQPGGLGASAGQAKEHVQAAADDFKAAATAKAEEIRRAAEQKADELRSQAEARAREFRGAAESAWGEAQSKAKTWQSEGETYVRNHPAQAVLAALGAGFVLGLLLRK
ncbi:MAG: DUF883 family protein [Verrucomicrobia bacterium]|nr:DUF883 family protein [Verrucomicrobiota bacterium]